MDLQIVNLSSAISNTWSSTNNKLLFTILSFLLQFVEQSHTVIMAEVTSWRWLWTCKVTTVLMLAVFGASRFVWILEIFYLKFTLGIMSPDNFNHIEYMKCRLLQSMSLGICRSVVQHLCANTAERIKVLLGMETPGDPRNVFHCELRFPAHIQCRMQPSTNCFSHSFCFSNILLASSHY